MKDAYSLIGSDIFVLVKESLGIRALSQKKYLHWLMIGKILLHIGKNPSKMRHCMTNVTRSIL